jgi:hypothetical protein
MSMFARDPFDIAPSASRYTTISWMALATGLAFALVGATLLQQSLDAVSVATEARQKSEQMSRALAAREAAARAQQSNPRSLDRMREQQRLQQILRASWSGLFDALEVAAQQVQGHVTVLGLAPVKTQTQAVEIGLTALAVSNETMLDYVRALGDNPHVREVRLLSQQPTLSGTASLVRFQLSVLWDARSAASGLRPDRSHSALADKGAGK